MERYTKVDHRSRNVSAPHSDFRKSIITQSDLPVHVFPRKDPFNDDSGFVRRSVKPAIESRDRNRFFRIPSIRTNHGRRSTLLDHCFDRLGIESRIEGNLRSRKINSEFLHRGNEISVPFNQPSRIRDVHGLDPGKPKNESFVLRYGYFLFSLLMLVSRISDSLPPFLATVFEPSP